MNDEIAEASAHYLQSTLRERIVEHVFVGDALRRLWQKGIRDVEVLRSEFDAGGYDLVMSHGKIVRHIQFKTSTSSKRKPSVNANLKLMDKQSGCIIWIELNSELEAVSYLWLGGLPGESLPDIRDMKPAKHSKGDSKGKKAERPFHRIVRRKEFKAIGTLDELLGKLFGDLTGSMKAQADQLINPIQP